MPTDTPTLLTLRVLTAMADGRPRHGYALLRHLRTGRDGYGAVRPGTLYRALERLAREDRVTASPAPTGGRRSRLWTISPAGRQVLHRERRRLRTLLRADPA